MKSLIAILACCLAGCANFTPIKGPQTYNDGAISFEIPEDWTVTIHGVHRGRSCAFIEAPGSAVVFIKGEQVNRDPGLEEYAKKFSREVTPKFPFVGLKLTPSRISPVPDKHQALKEQFSIALLGIEVPHTRIYRRRPAYPYVYYILTQVPDKGAASAEKGFEEIVRSFSVNNQHPKP